MARKQSKLKLGWGNVGVPISGLVNNSYCFHWPKVRNDSRDAYWEFSPLEQKMKDNRGSVNFWHHQYISLSITAWQVDWNKTLNAIFCMKDRPWYAMLSLAHSIPLPCTFSKLISYRLRFITLFHIHLLGCIIKEKNPNKQKQTQKNKPKNFFCFKNETESQISFL